MSPAYGRLLGIVILVGLTFALWKVLVAIYRSQNKEPISGPAALGKGVGIASVAGPFVEMCLSIAGASLSEEYESSLVFVGLALVVVASSAYFSGYVAAHTYEDTRLMNGKLNALIGGLARVPALFLLAATRPSVLTWLSFLLFFPIAMVGAIHRDKTAISLPPVHSPSSPGRNTDA